MGRATAPLGARAAVRRWDAGALTSITSVGRLERASRGRGGRRAGCPGQALQTFHVAAEEGEVAFNGFAGRPACDCSRSTYRTETRGVGGAPGPLPAGPLACMFLRILTIICTHPHHPHRQRRIPDEGEFPSRARHALQRWTKPLEVACPQRSRGHRQPTRAAPTGASVLLHSQLHYPVRLALPSSYIANWPRTDASHRRPGRT